MADAGGELLGTNGSLSIEELRDDYERFLRAFESKVTVDVSAESARRFIV